MSDPVIRKRKWRLDMTGIEWILFLGLIGALIIGITANLRLNSIEKQRRLESIVYGHDNTQLGEP